MKAAHNVLEDLDDLIFEESDGGPSERCRYGGLLQSAAALKIYCSLLTSIIDQSVRWVYNKLEYICKQVA